MNKLQTIAGATAAAIGLTLGAAAMAEETGEKTHPCQDITTTTDTMLCIESAINLEELANYMALVDASPAHREIYEQVDGEPACRSLVTDSRLVKYFYDVSVANPGREFAADTITEINEGVSAYFTNAAACYGQSMDLYAEAGLTGHEEALGAVQQAAQNAVDAIGLEP